MYLWINYIFMYVFILQTSYVLAYALVICFIKEIKCFIYLVIYFFLCLSKIARVILHLLYKFI